MTKRVVLIGHPVAHSLSGAMQQAAFDSLGIDATYEAWDRAPIELAEAVAALRTDDFLGANVTIPHKERVVPMVDRLTEEAHATGAVNTITREGKRLIGHNTDVPGFKVALDRLVGKQKMPRQAVVLGAGGGARAVVHGLITEGFQRIIVFNRHLHRAESMVKHFSKSAAHMELRAMPWHESIIESELAKARVLINATSIGLTSDDSPIPAEALHGDLLVLDLIYARTKLLRDAEAAGCTVADGELMLLHQGAAAFTLWTGQPAPLELMQERLAAARVPAGCARQRASRPATGARRNAGRQRRRLTAGEDPRAGRGGDRASVPILTWRDESHGPALGVTIEGVPGRVDRHGRGDRGRPRPPAAGYGRGARQAIEQDRAEILGGVRHGVTLGSPVLLLVRNKDWENWTQVMAVEPLDEAAAEALFAAASGWQQAGDSGHPRPAGPCRPGRCAQVRLQRRPQRPGARLRPRDRGAGGRRAPWPGPSCASSGSRSGRSPPRWAASRWTPPVAPARATKPTPRRFAARIRRPRSG